MMQTESEPSISSSSRDILTRYGHWVVKWRWPIALLSIAAALAFGTGAPRLYFDTDYRAFFGEDNPDLQAFEALQNIYTRNDNVLLVMTPPDGNVFSAEFLAAVEEAVQGGWQIPFAIRVDAVTNYQHTEAEEDDLVVRDLVEGAADLAPEALAAARTVAVGEPFIRDRLIDENAAVTGVNITLQIPGEDVSEVTVATHAARDLAAQLEADHPGIQVRITGLAPLNNAFMEVSQEEMAALMPLMFLAMFVIMVVTLRSVSGTIATLLLVGLSVAVAMGMAGYANVGLTPPSAQAPIIIMTLAIADSIHILVTMLRAMARGLPKREAIVESLRVNMSPVFLTSLSTVIGFLTLNFSDVPPFNHLGNMTAVGVTAAFLLSILFLPAAVAILPIRAPKTRHDSASRFVDGLASLVVARPKMFLGVTAATVVALGAFIPANTLDDRFIEYFDQRVEFRNDTDYAVENLTGIYQVEFSLSGAESGSISDPDYLATVESFANWYRGQPGVVHVNTYTDVMKRLNKNMHGDDAAFYRLPDQRDLAAQYLLLYEMSLPYGLDLNNQINVDKSATRFTVTTENVTSDEIRALGVAGEEWLAGNAPPAMQSMGSGPMMMFSKISAINIRSMLFGSALALVVISVLMIFALRSLKLGLLSFLPNLLPAAVGFGVWGLMVGRVNLGLSIVIGMTLGIVVDDSIHFLSKYLRARREEGLEPPDAVRYAFNTVGRALVVTTVILVIGFSILATSAFDMNASMGKMTAITLAVALLLDFLMLPPLLLMLDRPVTHPVRASSSVPANASAR